MAGTTSNFNSNISLALSAAPQGVYGPVEQSDQDDHFFATQTLSEILSDTVTARILFLTAVNANKFVELYTPGTGNEAVGKVASDYAQRIFGFLKEDVKAGEYAVVWRRGVLKTFTGLTPGAYYEMAQNGDIAVAVTSTRSKVGWAQTDTTLIVDIMNTA